MREVFLRLFIVLRFFLSFYLFYFQELSENHPVERASWLKIIIIIIIIIIIKQVAPYDP